MIENPKKFIGLLLKERYNIKKQELNLECYDNICDQSIGLVFKNIDCPSLKILILTHNDFSNDLFRVLRLFKWGSLLQLYLDDNKISSEGVQMLTKINFPQLKYMSFKNMDIKNEGVQTIIKKIASHETTGLVLQNTKFTFKALRDLSTINVDKFSKMKHLNLNKNSIGNKGVQYLIKVNLPIINSISLSGCNIQNEGIKYLSKSSWPLLGSIQLQENHISYLVYKYLNQMNFQELRNIKFSSKGLDRQFNQRFVRLANRAMGRQREVNKLFPSIILLYQLTIINWLKIDPSFIQKSLLSSYSTTPPLFRKSVNQVIITKFQLSSS